eukprot:7651040-Heterocapsa_arctica.AAC.1
MGAGIDQEVVKEWRPSGTAREDWSSAAQGFPVRRTDDGKEATGRLEPRLELQHNGTTGIRIGEAKKPGQE